MSAELNLKISLTELQRLYQQHDKWRLNGRHIAAGLDDAGHFGASEWLPRTYSCSFCAREFRSAQALGGHMNVHRRDRARLLHSGPDDSKLVASSGKLFLETATALFRPEKVLLDLLPVKGELLGENGGNHRSMDDIEDDGMLVDLELRLGWL